MLASEKQVLARLEGLRSEELAALKGSFMRNINPRLRKEAANVKGVAYTKTDEYARAIDCADLAKLARLIKSVGALLQVKAYLFWEK